ncbi:MAG: tyrosine-type recombinase/integrase, partial [Planctomycetota bacterium]|nr:tyrosine-type recombinase/integrase [Planctomycetota bacterium]
MATIFKRSRSRFWYVKYYVHGQQVYRSLETTSERVARKLKEQIEADEVRGDLVAPSKTPLPEFLENFCQFLTTIRTDKSFSADASALRVFFGPICPSLKLGTHVNARFREDAEAKPIKDAFKRRHVAAQHLEDVTPEMIETFIARRIREDKIAPKTANRLREILHRMFQYAIKTCHFVSPDRRFPNPAAAVERRPEPAPEIRYLTAEQIDEQLDALEDRATLKTMVGLYIYAGLRREEALWLTAADVDLSRRLIYVRAKTVDGQFWQPKTKRNRVVPISNVLHDMLSAFRPEPKGPWFFTSPNGCRWNPDNFSQELRQANTAAGLPWHCLDFRHTFGTHLAQK